MTFILKKTITETFLERVKTTPSHVGFQFKAEGTWKKVTFKEFYQECLLVSYGLMGLGFQPGDKAVILSNTRYEWTLCDMAILGAAGVTVPVYASNTSEDVGYVIQHAEARVVFAEDAKQLEKILEKRFENPHGLPLLEKIVLFEPSAMLFAERNGLNHKNILTLQALKELGKREAAKDPQRFDRQLLAAKQEDLITICYTSGTTGIPKGVMLTHDNFMSVLEDCVTALSPHLAETGEVVLSFLPFSHIFGKVESLAVYTFGWRQAFAENFDKLFDNLGEIKPTLIFSVPRIFEKAFQRIYQKIEAESSAKKKMFQWAMQAGKKYYQAVWAKKTPALVDRVEYALAKKLVFNQVAQRLGGNLRFAICGGAPLPKEIGEFFQISGIQILEGYGLTETTAPVCVNTPETIAFGSVGRPLSEVTLKIAEDGEILVKSRKVFRGYYKMPDETNQVLKDGWFHTGDIGKLDLLGALHITDRKKDLIITSGGKNIAPQKIENIAKSQKMMNQFVVHGDRRHYLTALVTLDHEQVVKYANEQQILFSEYSELIKNPKILSLTQKMIDDVNCKLANFETIKKFVILPNEFTVEGGELTPSMKVRRNFISKRYQGEVDSMYGDSARVSLDSARDIR